MKRLIILLVIFSVISFINFVNTSQSNAQRRRSFDHSDMNRVYENIDKYRKSDCTITVEKD